MKAVNLIPKDRRSNRAIKTGTFGPSHALLVLSAVAVGFVAIFVLEKNTVSDRHAQLAGLNDQVAQEQALASSLQQYTTFEQQAQQRAETVRTIIGGRFDWQASLDELSRVIPAGTRLNSLTGTIVPGASAGGTGGSGGAAGGVRAVISAPAFELTGCTRTQDDVAALMSDLRLINGVTRVTLNTSNRTVLSATSTGTGTTSGSGFATTCTKTAFDLVVFFTPIANAGAQGISSLGTTGVTGTVTPTTSTGGAQ